MSETNNFINAGRPVYFTYARNDENHAGWEHIDDIVTDLRNVFIKSKIEYSIDTEDVKPGGIITDYENEIGKKSECIILVFSEKYFKSFHCMYEFVQIKKYIKGKKILCIKSGNFNLDIDFIRELEEYWLAKKGKYETAKYHRDATTPIEDVANINGFYLKEIRSLRSFFSNINYYNANNKDNKYWEKFFREIIRFYEQKPIFFRAWLSNIKSKKNQKSKHNISTSGNTKKGNKIFTFGKLIRILSWIVYFGILIYGSYNEFMSINVPPNNGGNLSWDNFIGFMTRFIMVLINLMFFGLGSIADGPNQSNRLVIDICCYVVIYYAQYWIVMYSNIHILLVLVGIIATGILNFIVSGKFNYGEWQKPKTIDIE